MSLPKRIEIDAEQFFVEPYSFAFESVRFTANSGLFLGVSGARTYETEMEVNKLAVYAITEEGTGATIENLGLAQDGVLNHGTWVEEPNGAFSIRNGQITFPHHPTMISDRQMQEIGKVGEHTVQTSLISNATGAVLIRDVVSGQIAYKAGFFKIEVVENGTRFRFTHYARAFDLYNQWQPPPEGATFYVIPEDAVMPKKEDYIIEVIEGQFPAEYDYRHGVIYYSYQVQQSFDAPFGSRSGQWNLLSWIMSERGFQLFLNGEGIANAGYNDRYTNDQGSDLIFGGSNFVGDMDHLFYMGTKSATEFLNQLDPSSGAWASEVIDLLSLPEFADLSPGDRLVFEMAYHAGFGNEDHSIDLTVRMSDYADFRSLTSETLDLKGGRQDFGSRMRYYAQTYVFGRYLQLSVSLRKSDLAVLAPIVKSLRLRFRAL